MEETRAFGELQVNKPSEMWMSLSTETCMIIYGTLVSLLVVQAISRSVFFYTICMKASVRFVAQKLFLNIFNTL